MSTIEINSQNVAWIGGNLYCLTPEALAVALEQLRTMGYAVEDLRDPSNQYARPRFERGVTVEELETDTYGYMWYVHLPQDVRKGKCNSCGAYISTVGIQTHGHPCEVCGEPTYFKIIDGTTIRFRFRSEERTMFGPELNMEAKRWDTEKGYLYLKYEFHGRGIGVLTGDNAEEFLQHHAGEWEWVEEDGEKLIKIFYPLIWDCDTAVIEPMEMWGHHFNHKIVQVWDGVEYSEYDFNFPVPQSIHIYETWRWAKLEPSPVLHKRVLAAINNHDDKGWHYQDGRPWFNEWSFEQMGLFIRLFTTLDADAWDEQSKRFRLDGPGGIDDVAAFCHPDAQVEDRPNIGNFLIGFGKVLSGDRLTGGEEAAMTRAWNEDRSTTDFAHEFVASGMRARYTRPLPQKIPRRLKKALRKPLSRRTSREQHRVHYFLSRQRAGRS